MEKFYSKFPQYRIQANHQIFLDAAEEDGGSERLTAEWMELQLDSLRGQLAVLQHTPDDQLNDFMAEHRSLDCEANRKMIAQHIQENYGSVEQAASDLSGQLAVNQSMADDEAAKKQQQQIQLQQQQIQQRQDYLRNHASPLELRQAARAESEQRRIEAQQTEEARQAAVREIAASGFDPIPERNQVTGEKLDSQYFIRLSNTDIGKFRNMIRRYGAAQITNALRERV
jgi:hypothetical protein